MEIIKEKLDNDVMLKKRIKNKLKFFNIKYQISNIKC